MTDIVERLRKRMIRREVDDEPLVKVFGDAADEIEKLRAQVVALTSSLDVGKGEGKKTP